MGIHGWSGLSPSLFSCSKLPRVATIGVSVAGNNRGFPWVATRWCFRALRRGASVCCDEVVLPCVAMRCFRALRRGASVGCDKTSKPLGKAGRQPSISSATIPSFRHHHRLSPSSSFAIIVFRHHCVSPSLCFAVIKFHHHQVSPSSSRFVKFTWNLKGHSRHLQGISRVQVEPNCVHLDPNLELTT